MEEWHLKKNEAGKYYVFDRYSGKVLTNQYGDVWQTRDYFEAQAMCKKLDKRQDVSESE